MIRAIIEDAAELAGLALFLAALAMIAAPADAMAGDGIAAPASCLAWIVPSMVGGGVAGAIAVALFMMRRAMRAFGDDVAEHDNNERDWMRSESIKGRSK